MGGRCREIVDFTNQKSMKRYGAAGASAHYSILKKLELDTNYRILVLIDKIRYFYADALAHW